MNAKEFVANWDALKAELLESFMARDGGSDVAARVHTMVLSPAQTEQMRNVLDVALRDTMYTLLLALDGAASLGDDQQQFTISDEEGNVIEGIEHAAWERFHEPPRG
ncbi:MAG: hypothetical protein E2591_19555 [Achromobacter sp.]|uniref:hypothetical protein n=1 Tax=Achromobacter sp. TaxID=134375 RepID=UPI0012BE6803|nr:hypothetical protein [Achromobacter sp.]MPS80269.1 hypothetical protein [Achromobacter sp.]